MLNIAIIDDNKGIRNELQLKIKSYYNHYNLILAASNGSQFLSEIKNMNPKPQLVLMDIDMPKLDGIETVRLAKIIYPEIKFLMLTIFDDDNKIFEAIKAGCSGYLLKDEPFEKIHEAIEDIWLRQGAPMSPKIAYKTLQLLRTPNNENKAQHNSNPLSIRETEILENLINGLDYKEIANKIIISPNTVRNHIANIYEKLHVTSKLDAVKVGMNNKKWFAFI
jgi:DNA-binding NarL/FixJ family response regulator